MLKDGLASLRISKERGFSGGIKNIDVHIRRLRQKLELSKYFVTVPRFGYQFG